MLTKKESLRIVRPHYMALLTVLSQAKSRLGLIDSERHALRKTTIANFFRDLAVDEARRTFDGMQDQGVSIVDQSDSSFYIEFSGFHLGINGAVWIRIKKVGAKFLTSNIPTKKANKFNSQDHIGYASQPYLNGEEWGANPKSLQPTHLNIGHQWDELGTDIQDVAITCPANNSRLAWIEKVGDSGVIDLGMADAGGNVSNFPVRLEVSRIKPKRISAKSATKKEKVQKDGTSS